MIRPDSGGAGWRSALARLYWRIAWSIAWHVGQLSPRVHGRGPLLVAMGDSLTDPFVGFVFPWQIWVRRVGRRGFRTVNLGVGGHTTSDMRRRVDEFISEGLPEFAVLFAGSCDIEQGLPAAETEQNVTFIVEWLQARDVRQIALISPGIVNLPKVPDWLEQVPDWSASAQSVASVLREVAIRHDAVFVDLAEFHRNRISRGLDPDFARAPYRQSRSWHASAGDAHFNAYGNRLVAEALLEATAAWRPPRPAVERCKSILRRMVRVPIGASG